MDLKKIFALAMMALMVIPSLTMVRADGVELAEGEDLASAITRARLYLDKVRASADSLADEYSDDEMIQGYLNEIYELLGQEVAVLVNETQKPGNHSTLFSDPSLPSGAYFYRVNASPGDGSHGFVQTKKMVIVR